jgi:fucose permease
VILIGFMVEQSTEGWSALYLERSLGAGAAQGALGPAILGFTMAAGRLAGQALIKRVNEVLVIGFAALLSASGTLLASFAPSLMVAYVGFAILGLGVSVLAPMAFSHVGRNVTNAQRTTAISRVSVIGYTGFFIGPPLMGFVSEGFGLSTSFALLAVLLLSITCIFAPLLAVEQRKRHAG